MNLREYLAQQQQLVDAELDRLVPPETTPPETIHRAMRYSLFAGGKRIRPILCIEAARTVPSECDGVVAAACSLELIHTYSLIHDDLPALDNDDYRRGKLTNHKVFGDAMAILAGDSLLTLAFQVLAQLDAPDDTQGAPDRRTRDGRGHGGRHDRRTGGRSGRRRQAARRANCWKPSIAPRPARCCAPALRMGAIYAGASDDAVRGALLLRRTRRAGVPDCRRHSGRGRVVRGAGQDRGQGRAAAQDHLPGGLRPGGIAAHGARRNASARTQVLAPFGDRAQRLHELADLIVRPQIMKTRLDRLIWWSAVSPNRARRRRR